MNMNDQSPKPSPRPPAPEAGSTPPPQSSREYRQALLEEILTLARSGEDQLRLRQLLRALDAERLREIDKVLAPERAQAHSRLLEARRVSLDIMRPFEEASRREDLTVPELIFLAKVLQRHVRQLHRSLVAERELLEKKLWPGKAKRKLT
jgi:hypothetical protein